MGVGGAASSPKAPSERTARRQALALVCAAVVLTLTTWFSATAVVPELAARWQMGPASAAWLTNGVQLGFVLGAVAASLANLSDLVRLHRLMATCAALVALANASLLVAPGPGSAIAARIATGILLAGVYPPALKLVSTWFRRGRGLALGAVIGALTLGSATPHAVRYLGGVDWRFVVVAASGASLLGALLFVRTREGPYPFSRAAFDPRQMGAVLRNRPLLLANLGYFGHMWELYAAWGWCLAYSREALARQDIANATSRASLLTFAAVSVGVAGCLLGGFLADRFGRTATTIGMMAVSGSCALAMGLVFNGPTPLFVALLLVWGISVIGDSAQFSAAVTEVGDSRFVGTALTLQLGLGFALTIASIYVTGLVAEALGSWRWSFLVLVPGPLLGIWAMAALRRHPDAGKMANGRR